jgi:hypothetical protein
MNPSFARTLEELGHAAAATGECALAVEKVGTVETLADVWRLLPAQGEGIVVLADRVTRFNGTTRESLLLEADVVTGDATLVVRARGQVWDVWRWQESVGSSYRYVEMAYLSTEHGIAGEGSRLRYRAYWQKVPDDGLWVWQPLGSRFCGFDGD